MAERRYPKSLPCSVYFPNRRLVEFTVKLRNIPGALAKVSRLLSKEGVNILSGFHDVKPCAEFGTWGFFADLTDANVEPEEAAKLLGSLDVVLEVRFSEAEFDGLLIDRLHFPLMVLGRRSTVWRVDTFGDMFRRIYEKFGTGGAFILYDIGLACGEGKAERVREEYGLEGLTALRAILSERAAKGWGIAELVEFNRDRFQASVKVEELFECLPFKGRFKESRSQFFRGYLTGVFQKLFNRKFETNEVKCIAKGDPYCMFELKVGY